ncbi:fibronectin type III domain-containing protein [Tenacibaculum vairaonense]|uniref:fibronectin type III domain-containing protein n=1 Tax=Tenacibaculum vairaonense TaxID=3137860 RepID=UPI00399D65E8
MIENSTDSVDHLNPDYVRQLGSGRVNAFKALKYGDSDVRTPSNITISEIGAQTAIVNWDLTDKASRYRIKYRSNNGQWVEEVINGTSVKLYNLIKGTSYEIQVRAESLSKMSEYSSIIKFSTISIETPQKIIVSAITTNKATISWNRNNEANQYELRYKKKEKITWMNVLPTINASQVLINLAPNTFYEVQVKASKEGVSSLYSNSILFLTLDDGSGGCNGIAIWEKDKTYGEPGMKAVYNHVIYQNKWWSQGNIPGTTDHWKKIGECESDNNIPTVSITSPLSEQVIIQSSFEAITLSANATDSDGTIDKIQFSVNNTNLAQGNNIDWIPTAYGAYTIKVEVTDNLGATAVDIITITVKEEKGNQPPELTMVTPVNGQIFEQDVFKPIALKVNATDSDGTIESIQFSVNNIDLEKGNDKEWIPESYGDYIIKVIVTDDKQAITSKQITITIKQPVTNVGCEGIAVWDVAKEYNVAGLQVVHKKNIYESKWWTKNEEPGTGGPWGPWKLIRVCSEVQNFIVSPNPVQNRLKLKANILPKMNVQVSVSTLAGELIKEEVLKAESNSLSFDVSSLQKGIYVLKIKTQQYTQTQKILIE